MSATDKYKLHAGYWIKRTYWASSNQVNEVLRPYGLARGQWEVLFYIHHNKSISHKELQNILQIESATLTGMVDSLEKKGWIMRAEGVVDRRSKTLSFTKAGLVRWQKIPDPIYVVLQKMMRGISKEEEMVAIRILQKMLNNLES